MTIRFERDGAIGHIVLANPPKNLIASDFSDALKQAEGRWRKPKTSEQPTA